MPVALRRTLRVAVTGVGAVTSQGLSASRLWEGVRAGRVAIAPVQKLPMRGFQTSIGGEVTEAVVPDHDYRRPVGFHEPAIDFLLKAAEEAVAACGLDFRQVPPERWAVVIGTCNGGMTSGEEWLAGRLAWGASLAGLAQLFPAQALAEAVSSAFGIKGPALSVNTACAAGANAIGYGHDLITSGQADAVIAGASDAFSALVFAGFSAMEALSPTPAAPYARGRQGLSVGEGSGVLVLVRDDLARELGAPILAQVLGYGLSADGHHPTAPDPNGAGAARAMRAALESAGVTAEMVGYVNGHGTGTALNDPAESRAIRLALGDHAGRIPVSSSKSMLGHLMGAAGAVEAIVTIGALNDQVAPPTANYDGPDPECDLDYVPNVARPMHADIALSNNFAFGGANACLVLARAGAGPQPPPRAHDRVVATGVAAITCAGPGPLDAYLACAAERTCTSAENGHRLGRVDLDPSEFIGRRDVRRFDRTGLFAVAAAKLALADAGLVLDEASRVRTGVACGTALGPAQSLEAFMRPMLVEGPEAVAPSVFPNTVFNAAAGHVAMQVGAVGPTTTVTCGHAAGAASLCYAAELLARDDAAAMISVGVDTLTDLLISAYSGLGLTGGVGRLALAEAGVAIVLERWGQARERGAAPYGEVLGYASAADGLGIGSFDPRGRGLARAMGLALDRAGTVASEVTAVWSGLNGLRSADIAESIAIRRVLGRGVPVRSPKLFVGEPVGASGSLCVALALQSWRQGAPRGPVLINSSSLGGTHFSMVLVPMDSSEAGPTS